MTRIFLDANVLVSVLNKEFPLFNYSSRILSLANHQKFEVYTSPMCLAIAFYFAEKKNKSTAKEKISILCQHIKIADNVSDGVTSTLSNKKINDFEDGLEYYAASRVKCNCIVTEDIDDFYFSEIEVLSCKNFFDKYLLN
ncbi:type II toxin-antitoxin system VapC family toxin [Pedobacter xixiisoli]|uniref:Predicted nucleic acid-binding protein, contains PIN domain n=1 Tax=Pedobacter xixiisoli TaxID=1476464 RepID=A0A285ZTF6_9SPHI|nr:PIN domain-containing protein [Pedobacter xixiisoli]SOD12920.1 Predicted nucleic acid-binding protein, contains PIN domain [Pedobacter xixiisoli]